MSSIGKHLLFSVLSLEDASEKQRLLDRLSDAGVTQNMFAEDEEQRTYAYVMDYRLRYGVCPSLSLVEVETGIRFQSFAAQQPFEFWFDEFRKALKHTVMLEMIALVEDNLSEGKVDDALTCIGNAYSGLTDLMAEHRSTAKLSELAGPILQKHDMLQRGLVHDGILTGFPYIDRVTGGAQPGDAWVIAGSSGAGKTFVTCKCALHAVNTGRRCLFISMEMPNMQMGRRSIAMSSQVSSGALRLGRLSRFGVDQIRDFLRTWDSAHDDRLLFVEGRVNYSIREIKARIKEFRPDALFVDGAYMVRGMTRTQSRWEMNMEVMETLKQIAMSENIAVISTFQFDQKQKNKGVSTIMGGQAIGQLASVVIGIENIEDRNTYNGIQFKELTLYKGREGETGKIRLRYDMNRTIIEEESVIEGQADEDSQSEYREHEYDDDDQTSNYG